MILEVASLNSKILLRKKLGNHSKFFVYLFTYFLKWKLGLKFRRTIYIEDYLKLKFLALEILIYNKNNYVACICTCTGITHLLLGNKYFILENNLSIQVFSEQFFQILSILLKEIA